MKIIIPVNYALANEFRNLVGKHSDCEIVNVIEIKVGLILNFHINCPIDKETLIFDYGLMTFIINTEHQKYYNETDAFKKLVSE